MKATWYSGPLCKAPFANGGVFQLLLSNCLLGCCSAGLLRRGPSSLVRECKQPNLKSFFITPRRGVGNVQFDNICPELQASVSYCTFSY